MCVFKCHGRDVGTVVVSGRYSVDNKVESHVTIAVNHRYRRLGHSDHSIIGIC